MGFMYCVQSTKSTYSLNFDWMPSLENSSVYRGNYPIIFTARIESILSTNLFFYSSSL